MPTVRPNLTSFSSLWSRLSSPLLALVLAGSFVVVLGDAPFAFAQPSSEAGRAEARKLLRDGTAAFDRGEFSSALDKFQRALAAFPSARIQYNIGQTLRELGRPVEAAEAFEAFLAEADRITGEERSQTAAALSELESKVARVRIETNVPEVEITIDGRARGRTPLRGPIVLAPGGHEIILARMGYRSQRESITLRTGEQRRLTYQLNASQEPAAVASTPAPIVTGRVPVAPVAPSALPPTALPPAAPPEAPSATSSQALVDSALIKKTPAPDPGWSTQRTVGVSLLAASAGLAIGGVVLMGSAWTLFNEGEQQCTIDCATVADDVDSRTMWSRILFGAAALSAAGGATVIVLDPGRGGEVAHGLMFVKTGRF